MKVTKKSVTVDAWRIQVYDDLVATFEEEPGLRIATEAEKDIDFQGKPLAVYDGFHGWVPFSWGDWIIKGVKGEFYPCVYETFVETYDLYEPEHLDYDRNEHAIMREVLPGEVVHLVDVAIDKDGLGEIVSVTIPEPNITVYPLGDGAELHVPDGLSYEEVKAAMERWQERHDGITVHSMDGKTRMSIITDVPEERTSEDEMGGDDVPCEDDPRAVPQRWIDPMELQALHSDDDSFQPHGEDGFYSIPTQKTPVEDEG